MSAVAEPSGRSDGCGARDVGRDPFERRDDARGRTGAGAAELFERLLAGAPRGRGGRRHRLVGVADGDDPRAERDLLAARDRPGSRSPSQRSWVERTSRATAPIAGAAARIRSPIRCALRMNSHSAWSSGPACCRIPSGTPILPMSCSSAARGDLVELLGAASAELGRRRPRRARPTPSEVLAERRLALAEGAQEHVAGLALGRGAAALLRVHAPVGEPERLGRVAASSGMNAAPKERSTSKPSPCSKRRRRRGDRARDLGVAGRRGGRTRRRRGGRRAAACATACELRPSRASSASPAGWPKVSL